MRNLPSSAHLTSDSWGGVSRLNLFVIGRVFRILHDGKYGWLSFTEISCDLLKGGHHHGISPVSLFPARNAPYAVRYVLCYHIICIIIGDVLFPNFEYSNITLGWKNRGVLTAILAWAVTPDHGVSWNRATILYQDTTKIRTLSRWGCLTSAATTCNYMLMVEAVTWWTQTK